MTRITGFAPIVGRRPFCLVLGSVPSVASLQKQQYYGKPQNAFWRIMGALFAAGPELSYPQRAERLAGAGVAVWDVAASCVRPGSLDSSIDMASVTVNDFNGFLTRYPSIQQVFFNGRKAEDLWRRFVLPDLQREWPELEYMTLPSTSPAMASLDFAAKLERWRVVAIAAGHQ